MKKQIKQPELQINDAIYALQDGRWGVIAELIYQAHTSDTWFPEYKSFTEWMAHISKDYKISRARCWRYRKAAIYYKTLQTRNEELVELAELPSKVSAEALEILERLERVAKPDIIEEITAEILNGTMPIRRLKQTWWAYSDDTPQQQFSIAGAKKHDRTDQLEADCLIALNEHPIWTGHQQPARYRVFKNVCIANQAIAHDAIVLVQNNLDSQVEIHSIQFWDTRRLGDSEINLTVPPHTPYADYCWFLLSTDDAVYIDVASELARSQHCGLMILKSGMPEVAIQTPNKEKSEIPSFIQELLKLSLKG